MASPAKGEPVTIVAVGDSLTQGFGLPVEDGLVPQLQAWLDAQGAEARVINAGVSGDTTAGGLSRIAWTLTEDVDAVILALGSNDALRGIDPASVRANLDGTLAEIRKQALPVLLVGVAAPGNYGPDYKTSFDALFPEFAESYGALFHPNLLAPILAIEDRADALATYVQPDGLHPNADGVALIVESIGPSVLSLIEQAAAG